MQLLSPDVVEDHRRWAFEDWAQSHHHFPVAGIDEAGRGPLCGPVVAGAVIFTERPELADLNDSKLLSEEQRERLYDEIIASAAAWGVGMASAREIEEHNILGATYVAVRRALGQLSQQPQALLTDFLKIPGVDVPQVPLVKGDQRSLSISAASVLAKVTRDRMMVELDSTYPGYGLASHKGYPTPSHRKAIAGLGPCPEHRRTFKGVREHLPGNDLLSLMDG